MTRKKYFQKRNNKIFALEKYIKGKSVYSRIIRRSTIVLIGTKLSNSRAELGCTRWDEITFPQFLKWLSQSRRSIEAASWRWDRDFPLHFISDSMSAAALCVGKSFWFYPIRLRSSTLLLMQIDTPCHSQNPNLLSKVTFKMDLCGLGQSRGKCSFNLFAQMF